MRTTVALLVGVIATYHAATAADPSCSACAAGDTGNPLELLSFYITPGENVPSGPASITVGDDTGPYGERSFSPGEAFKVRTYGSMAHDASFQGRDYEGSGFLTHGSGARSGAYALNPELRSYKRRSIDDKDAVADGVFSFVIPAAGARGLAQRARRAGKEGKGKKGGKEGKHARLAGAEPNRETKLSDTGPAKKGKSHKGGKGNHKGGKGNGGSSAPLAAGNSAPADAGSDLTITVLGKEGDSAEAAGEGEAESKISEDPAPAPPGKGGKGKSDKHGKGKGSKEGPPSAPVAAGSSEAKEGGGNEVDKGFPYQLRITIVYSDATSEEVVVPTHCLTQDSLQVGSTYGRNGALTLQAYGLDQGTIVTEKAGCDASQLKQGSEGNGKGEKKGSKHDDRTLFTQGTNQALASRKSTAQKQKLVFSAGTIAIVGMLVVGAIIQKRSLSLRQQAAHDLSGLSGFEKDRLVCTGDKATYLKRMYQTDESSPLLSM